MDASPVAQLIEHARGAQAARQATTDAAHQIAAAAEANRPGKAHEAAQQVSSAGQ